MILIAGLGNPGDEYRNNRHNIGFQFINYVAKRLGKTNFITKKRKSDFLPLTVDDRKVTLVKPLTFINNSGEAILFMAAFLKVKETDILVCYDDINLDFGDIRISNTGKDTEHNGIKSVRALLKKENFTRMRIGVGSPVASSVGESEISMDNENIYNYVLSDFTLVEEFLLENIVFKHAFDVIMAFVNGGFEKAENEIARVRPIIKDELAKEPSLPEFD